MIEANVVGIAQIAICHAPEQLICLGLGSCVAVILYDPGIRTGGIVHVLLPHAPAHCDKVEKYADTGTRKLISEIINRGAKKERIVAKLIGGAQMFPGLNLAIANIGKENSMTARKVLTENRIKIVAEDLDGNKGRSAYFDSTTGQVTIKTAFAPTKVI